MREWRTGYSIRFESRPVASDGVRCTATIFVPTEMVERYRGRNQLRQTLAAAITRGRGAVYCYVFGHITRTIGEDGKPGDKIDVAAESLHSLVVKLVEDKGGER